MNVAWNLLFLRPGVVGGTEVFTTTLARALGALAPDVDVSMLVLASFAVAHPDLVAGRRVATAPVSGRVRMARVAAESTWMRSELRRWRPDVVHHLGGTVPRRGAAVPQVVTIHDLQPLRHPEHFSPLKRAFLARALPAAVRRAEVVCVLTDHVRGDVVERLGADPSRVVVVGVPWMTESALPTTLPAGLPERYVLYPAITYPHKDHVTLVRAMRRLPDDVGLVLTGGVGSAEAGLREEIDRLGLGSRVTRLGRVEPGVLSALFRAAAVVAVPSRFEGFGIPVVEAFRAGVPVVVADAGALTEVAGDAGVVVPGGQPDALADALGRVLADDALAATLVARGRARVAAHPAEAIVAAQRRAYALARQVD